LLHTCATVDILPQLRGWRRNRPEPPEKPAMIPVSPDVDPEQTILTRAHQIVTRWQQMRRPGPFDEVVQRSLDAPWDPFLTADVRQAIRRVADAIRDGRGHAFQNREPLVSIVRRTVVR
jgi:hypothetical protein